MATTINNNNTTSRSRIPATLQAVFLASNRGKEVYKPPPAQVAQKTFFYSWFSKKTTTARKDETIYNRRSLLLFGKKLPKQAFKPSVKKPVKEQELNKTVSGTQTKQTLSSKPVSVEKPVVTKEEAHKLSSLQDFLNSKLKERGYSTKTYQTMSSAYSNKPTTLQKASYDVHLIELVRGKELEEFRSIMSCGISPNPCNEFGESLLHLICRRGQDDFLKVMIECGCSLQIADDYGRTPLHDACWAAEPCFPTVEILMKHDRRLFHMTDKRGSVPLTYVNKDHRAAWMQFLESKLDEFWPIRTGGGEEEDPPLTLEGPNSRPIPDPENALTPDLARMVASGRMEPDEAQFLKYDNNDDVTCEESDESESSEDEDYDSEDDDDDSNDDDDESDCSDDFDEEEMAEMLRIAGGAQ